MAFKLAELFVGITVDGLNKVDSDLNKTKARVRKLGESFQALGSKITGIGRQFLKFGALLSAPLLLSIKIFADTGDELQKMSLRTGIAVEELSKLAFVASQGGTDLATFETAIKTMQRGLVDASRGLTTATDNFDDLGIALEDIKDLSPSEQFTLLADKLAQIEDPSLRAGLALKVFGRSGAQLLPMLADGVGGMEKLKEKAVELGIVMSDEDAQAAADLTDALDILFKSVKQLFIEIGTALSGSVKQLALDIAGVIKIVFDWIKENKGLVIVLAIVAAGVLALGGTLVVLGIAISTIGTALLFLAANPIGAVITVVALVVLALLAWIGVFSDLSESQKETQKQMKKTTSDIKKQKEEIEKLSKAGEKTITVKTKLETDVEDDEPISLAGIGEFPTVGLKVKFKNVDEEVAKIQKEISFDPVFSGVEDLFRNAQAAFANKKAEQVNEDILKTNKINIEVLKNNTKALNDFRRSVGLFAPGGVFGMKPLGS